MKTTNTIASASEVQSRKADLMAAHAKMMSAYADEHAAKASLDAAVQKFRAESAQGIVYQTHRKNAAKLQAEFNRMESRFLIAQNIAS